MEPATAVFPLCSHIKPDGSRCAAAALRGMNLCFHHIGGRTGHLRATSTYSAQLGLLPAGTRETIQHNLSEIAQALSDGKIDIRTANTYLRLYRTAEQNLTRWEKANKNNPGKPMLPLPESQLSDEADTTTTTDVILSEREARVEEPALSLPKGPAFQNANPTSTPITDVILSEESAANAVEGPAFRDAGSNATAEHQDPTDEEEAPIIDKSLFEGMTYQSPSIEYTYELWDRIQKRHAERQAKKQEKEQEKEQAKAQQANQPPAA